MLMAEKITLAISIWIILILFITGDAELEIFFILTIIGFVIIKELTDHITTKEIKIKMNVFILIFMLAFMTIVTKRIIDYLAV